MINYFIWIFTNSFLIPTFTSFFYILSVISQWINTVYTNPRERVYTNCNRQFEGGRGAWDRVTKGHELDEGTASVSRSAGSVRPPQQFSLQDNLCLSFFFSCFLCLDTVTLRPTISGFLSFISSCWKIFCDVEVPLLHLFTGTDNIFLSFFFFYSPNFSSLRVSISWRCLWPTVVICFCLKKKQTNTTENNQQRLGSGEKKKEKFSGHPVAIIILLIWCLATSVICF